MIARDYSEFIASKAITSKPCGFDMDLIDLNPAAFDWQGDIIRYLLRLGRGGGYLNCGLGKSLCQLEVSHQIRLKTDGKVLILAPLAVAYQTKRESEKFGIGTDVTVCKTQADVRRGINITNYERLYHFNPQEFVSVQLDESSILKSIDSKTRKLATSAFASTPYRHCWSATPAPNDHMELGSQSEFLDVMTRSEMLSMFFVHDGGNTSQWRLKGHAQAEFWKWLASWSVMIRSPRDLGYDATGFDLPPLKHHQHVIGGTTGGGFLFPMEARTLAEERAVRRDTLEDRCEAMAELANKSTEPWVLWCNLNPEGDLLEKLVPDAVQIAGRHSIDEKEDRLRDFTEGKTRVLVTKPKMGGHGLNWQHCPNTAVMPTHSWEAWYQLIRRFYRFGQKNTVHVHAVYTEQEAGIVRNLQRKELDAERMIDSMVEHMADITSANVRGTNRMETEYNPQQKMELPAWLQQA